MRFPPHKRVADIKNYPSFGLRKQGVHVEVLEWVGETMHFEELQDVWVQIRVCLPSGAVGVFLLKLHLALESC